jgi:hypothetical protein
MPRLAQIAEGGAHGEVPLVPGTKLKLLRACTRPLSLKTMLISSQRETVCITMVMS